jgi:hypothetical protein
MFDVSHGCDPGGRRFHGCQPRSNVAPTALSLPQGRHERGQFVLAAGDRLGEPRDLGVEPPELGAQGVALLAPGLLVRARDLDVERARPGPHPGTASTR